jgi:hypothetical protein
MLKLVAATALLSGCLFDTGTSLADLPQLSASVDVDVGVPDDPGSGNYLRNTMDVVLEDPSVGCFTISSSASLELDGVEADYVVRGGPYEDDVHGHTETGCDSPSFLVNYLPSPRDVSVLTLADGSETRRITIEDFLVNPQMSITSARSSSMATIRVADARTLASARVWWRADLVDGSNQWSISEADVGTPGEIHFMVPAYAGRGTLMVAVTITDHAMDCSDFAACEVTVHGGAALPLTITN